MERFTLILAKDGTPLGTLYTGPSANTYVAIDPACSGCQWLVFEPQSTGAAAERLRREAAQWAEADERDGY